jgi:hypothetical protein
VAGQLVTRHTRFDDPLVRWPARPAREDGRTVELVGDEPGTAPTRAVGRDTGDRTAGRPLGIRGTPSSLYASRLRMEGRSGCLFPSPSKPVPSARPAFSTSLDSGCERRSSVTSLHGSGGRFLRSASVQALIAKSA